MEAVDFLTDFIKYFLLVIPVSAGAVITYFSLRKSLSTDAEECGHYEVKIKQTLKGAIIGISLSGFIAIVKTFYS
ncbi:hypothetical protein FDB61_17890 [Clostridium botulinum]|nr:hypothetical protein [Clostridium botulinum]